MRTLCPNLDREDALETVLEVPVPEEVISSNKHKSWQTIRSWMMRPPLDTAAVAMASRAVDIQFLLGVIAAPLIPLPIRCGHTTVSSNIKSCPIESSMAKYIVQQYVAAAGGEHVLNSISSMYAVGKVRMVASEILSGDDLSSSINSISKVGKLKNLIKHGRGGEIGGFVLWQKRPDLWSLELMVSGSKISAGSDGKVDWRQTPWQHSHVSRGPPRPLRRSLQGLDPRSTANLFSNSICIGEKAINGEDCFVLKMEAEPTSLRARSSTKVEIIRHTLWGCFSQRTGLLVQLEDSHLLRIKAPTNDVFWETTMESSILDYRTIESVNIAHSGRTCVSLFRFGENSESHMRTKMEEIWSIEEVHFNIKGLSMDCFLPPADLKREDEGRDVISTYGDDSTKNGGLSSYKIIANGDGLTKNGGLSSYKILANSSCRVAGGRGGSKVVAINEDGSL